MVGITDLIQFIFDYPELGWILVMGYLAYELRGKRGRIYKLDKKITSSIVVIRALSREGAEGVDEEIVDEYLVENGMEPEDFIKGEEDGESSRADSPNGSYSARSDGEGPFDLDEVIGDEGDRGKEGT